VTAEKLPSGSGGAPGAGPGCPAIEVDEATKVYPDGTRAVRGISFEVREGEVFGLLGPNGAGKSTTLGMLCGTVAATSGRILVAGHLMTPGALEVRRLMGVVFQASTLDTELSGQANLWLHARLWGMTRRDGRARIAELLDVVGLAERARRPVASYSGGMRRRLEIARALLARPRILVLDEPTVGLDPLVRDELWALITDLHRDSGVTVLVCTHYLEEAESVCDRVAIIDHGRLLALDSPLRLVSELGGSVLEVQAAGDPASVLDMLARTQSAARAPLARRGQISAVIDAEAPGLPDLVRTLQAQSAGVVVRRATLSDVFVHLASAEPEPEPAPARGPR
jgi:ABC-2 type transport system ATP-binding protein